jgi:hypothetical protein
MRLSEFTQDRESNVLKSDWWQVIEAMAGYVTSGFEYQELDSEWVRQALVAQGLTKTGIDQALDWLEMASVSGHAADVFSMAQPGAFGHRVPSPLERIFISEKVWRRIEDMRKRGIIAADLTERILESLRSMDTRDWDDTEIEHFIEDILVTSLPSTPDHIVKRLSRMGAHVPEFYS